MESLYGKYSLCLLVTPLLIVFTNPSLSWFVLQIAAAFFGYALTAKLLKNSQGEFLWNFCQIQLNEKLPAVDNAGGVEPSFDTLSNQGVRNLPWEGIKIPDSVNKSLEELFEQIIENYISSWYKDKISSDAAFIGEIRYQIRYAVSSLYRRIRAVDLATTILSEAVPLAVAHAVRVSRLRTKIDSSICPPQMVETKILEKMPDIHFALSSRGNEVTYLRQVADYLVGHLLDESRIAGRASDDDSPLYNANSANVRPWPSRICRHFLREIIVVSILLPLLDLIADPNTINHILIFLFDSDLFDYQQISPGGKQVELLHGLTDFTVDDTPDSLLQSKLSDILRDARQFQMLTMYMKDIHGPVNELFFLLHAGDAHERMLCFKDNDAALSDLHSDIWELFIKYIHEGAQEKVNLPTEITVEFMKAVESRKFDLLDRCMEKAYQLVYKRIQYEYVVPFCQSECFLGHLCGSPPVTIDELMNTVKRSNSSRRLPSASESSFSLSQFRNRFWKMIMPTPIDGSVDSPSSELLNHSAPSKESFEEPIETADDLTPADSNSFDQSDQLKLSAFEDEVEIQTSLSGSYEMPTLEPFRDMSKWSVAIPYVEPRRDPVNGHTMYVYVIAVERFDISQEVDQSGDRIASDLTQWSITRRYNEFYTLESKLLEFHGTSIKTEPLPARRAYSTKSRAVAESLREHFERFLRMLMCQPALKRSNLLFGFLTSDQELKETTQLSDLYPWNVVRKMPNRFARERGQNLKPYILSLLATTLAPQTRSNGDNDSNHRHGDHSDTSSLSSCNPEGMNRLPISLLEKQFGNYFPSAQVDLSHTECIIWTRSFFDALFYLLKSLFGLSRWPLWAMVYIRSTLSRTIDAVSTVLLRRLLHRTFSERNCIRMLRFVHDSIFGAETIQPTNQEKVLRSELAQRLTVEGLQERLPFFVIEIFGQKEFRKGVLSIFQVLQFPRLNKQLTYVYLDILIRKVFPFEGT